jgi:iron(III) transport system substrate-binding protein
MNKRLGSRFHKAVGSTVSVLAIAVFAFAFLCGAIARADVKALEEAARKEGPMTWYISFYGQEEADQTAAAFAKKYPGLSVIPLRTTTGAAFQRLSLDFKNNVPVASVVSLSGVGGYYDILMREGRLAEYVPETADKLSPAMKPTIVPGQLYPIGAGLMAIAYNTTKIKPADVPKTWKDLADPKWKGKLALSHPAFSGFDAAWLVVMNKQAGWPYFEALSKNAPLVQRSTFDAIRALNSGERLIATMPDMMALNSASKGNPLGIVYPTDGSVMIMGYTAILKNAPQPKMARLFTEFLLGVEHAKVVAGARYHSARPEVVTELPGGQTLKDIKLAPVVPSAEAEKELPKLIEKWRDTFGQ